MAISTSSFPLVMKEKTVIGVHSMHLWSITSGKIIFTCHIELNSRMLQDQNITESEIIERMQATLIKDFGFYGITIQPEIVNVI